MTTVESAPLSISAQSRFCIDAWQGCMASLSQFEDGHSILQPKFVKATELDPGQPSLQASKKRENLVWEVSPLESLVEDQSGRFNLWASNIGVFAPLRLSLDYRLRDAPDIRNLVAGLLASLLGDLHELKRLLDNVNIDESVSEVSDAAGKIKTKSSPDDSEIRMNIRSLARSMDRLNRLSVAIRRSGSESRDLRAANFIWTNDEGQDAGPGWKQGFAMNLVQREYPDASETLHERLAEAMLLRRKRILYRQSHQRRLAANVTLIEAVQRTVPPQPFSASTSQESMTKAEAIKSSKTMDTAATALDPERSQKTFATSVVSSDRSLYIGDKTRGIFPPLPPQLFRGDPEVLCPYCGFLMPRQEIETRKRWKRHVLKDLEPYICLFEGCQEAGKLYDDEKDWLSHMKSEHRMQWRCPSKAHSRTEPKIFGDRKEFELHLRAEHKGACAESQLPLLVDSCARASDSLFDSCPLAGPACNAENVPESSMSMVSPNSLEKHVMKHLIFLAVCSIPVPDDIQGDADSNASAERSWSNPVPDDIHGDASSTASAERSLVTRSRTDRILLGESNASGSFPPGTIFFHQPNGQSKPCRKVVVDVRGNNLICLPVTTYGGNATKKLNRAHQSKHAIIYTGSKPPNTPRDEPHLRKPAIRATIIRSPYVLNELSRVDYSTEVPLEHTDELSHLGQVKSADILLKEWKKVRGDTGSSAQKSAIPETDNAASSHTPQSHPSIALIRQRGIRSEAETDAEERASPPQKAVVRSDYPLSRARAEQGIASLKPQEVIVKGGRMVRLSKTQKSKRPQPDTSSDKVSKLPRPVRQQNAPGRKSVSAVPTQQTQRQSQGLVSRAQNKSLSPSAMVSTDTLTKAIESAVSQAMPELDSNKQKAASVDKVIEETAIHSQFNDHYNVAQVKPMFNDPPPPYDIMDFNEVSRPLVSQMRLNEPDPSPRPGRTADCSSSGAPAPNVIPPAPMPPSSGIGRLEQDDYEVYDASAYESEYDDHPIDLQMSERGAQQAFNTYLKPHQIGTGPGSSSQAESSRSGLQQQKMKRKDTLFLFFNSDWQHRALEGRLDTGADSNFISPRAAREVAHSYHKYRGDPIQVANGEIMMPEWLIFTYWSIGNVGNTFWHNSFIVFNQLPCDVIIGRETITKNDIIRANPKYQGHFLLRFTSSEDKKAKEKQEERRRRQEHNRQIAAQQNTQTYEELEQDYANEMHAQQGHSGQKGQ